MRTNNRSEMRPIALLFGLMLFLSVGYLAVDGTAVKINTSPIEIGSNDALVHMAEKMGWRGDGSPENPYLIENLTIMSNGTTPCISLENVDLYLTISNCYFVSPVSTAMEMSHCSHIRIENTSFLSSPSKETYVGIDISYSSDMDIRGNSMEVKMAGIKIFLSNNISVSENTIDRYGNLSFTGIDVSNSNDIRILDNSIRADGPAKNPFNSTELPSTGIETYSSGNITIDSNTLSNMSFAVLSQMSNNLIIKRNRISGNYVGVSVLDSSGVIYHNDFINNTIQATQKGGEIRWNEDYPMGGNYWSDYDGKDEKSGPDQDESGSDGIGDSPYRIQNYTDEYPLMLPYEDFTPLEYRENNDMFFFEAGLGILALIALLFLYLKKKGAKTE